MAGSLAVLPLTFINLTVFVNHDSKAMAQEWCSLLGLASVKISTNLLLVNIDEVLLRNLVEVYLVEA